MNGLLRRMGLLSLLIYASMSIASCDSSNSDEHEESGPKTWPLYHYTLRYAEGEMVPMNLYEEHSPNCVKSTVYNGSAHFDFPREGAFRVSLSIAQTLCNREQVLQSGGGLLQGKYTAQGGTLTLYELKQILPAGSGDSWSDFTGTVSSDGKEVSLFLHGKDDVAAFPVLSRAPSGRKIKFRFSAEES